MSLQAGRTCPGLPKPLELTKHCMSFSSRPSYSATPSFSQKRRLPPGSSTVPAEEAEWEDVEDSDVEDVDPDAEVGSAPLGITDDEWTNINKNERLKKEAYGKLLNEFDASQQDRYENYKRSGLKKDGVKKVAGFVLGGTVSPQVVLALRSVGKVFVGEIIEKGES
jgi:transcription initiation factor TFIID subunit 11